MRVNWEGVGLREFRRQFDIEICMNIEIDCLHSEFPAAVLSINVHYSKGEQYSRGIVTYRDRSHSELHIQEGTTAFQSAQLRIQAQTAADCFHQIVSSIWCRHDVAKRFQNMRTGELIVDTRLRNDTASRLHFSAQCRSYTLCRNWLQNPLCVYTCRECSLRLRRRVLDHLQVSLQRSESRLCCARSHEVAQAVL